MTNYYIASYTIDKKTDKNLETIIEKYFKKHGVLISKSSCVRLLINSSVDKYDWGMLWRNLQNSQLHQVDY